jgi:hypothetical protein
MRRHLFILLILAFLVTPVTVAGARPRLDREFGLHRGYWLRTSGPWSEVKQVLALPGGAAMVLDGRGTVGHVTGGGRPDYHLRVPSADGGQPIDMRLTWWGGRTIAARTSFGTYEYYQLAETIDRQGGLSPFGVGARFTGGGHPPWSVEAKAVLVPLADGSLANVGHTEVGPGGSSSWPRSTVDWITVVPAGGALGDGARARIDPPIGEQVSRVVPIASADGLLVTSFEPAANRIFLRRITRAGASDPGFAPVWLLPAEGVSQMLRWGRDGAIVLTDLGRLLYVDGHGAIVHRRGIRPGGAIALDPARGLLVLHPRADGSALVLRRLRPDATTDTAFGVLALRAGRGGLAPLAVIPQSGGRVLALGRAAGRATIGWGVRTR